MVSLETEWTGVGVFWVEVKYERLQAQYQR